MYLDGNANNAFDEGERSTLTNGDGWYIFEELDAGTHRIREVVKEGFTRTAPDGNGTHEVTLGADSREDGFHFGNRSNETEESASIRGLVFDDLNGNGMRQDGEPPLAGWLVYLDGNNNGRRDDGERAAETNGDGRYVFEELAAGTYRVRLGQETGWDLVAPASGLHLVTLANGQAANERHFANRRDEEEPPAESASIRGVVFNDLNGDGNWQDGEPPLANRVIYLDANNNGQRDDGERAATTNGDGRYAFEELAAGTYRVREVLPAGWTITRPGDGFYVVQLADGQAANERIFGNQSSEEEPPPPPEESASIRGVVFNDLNGDGNWQDGEPPLANRVIYLDQNNNGQRDEGERAVATNGDGRYAFEELAAGTYRVREVLPAGWTITRPGDGFYLVTLANGQAANERIFGNRAAAGEEPPPPEPVFAEIRGFVFDDVNGDGVRQDGEPPLGGWVVYLDQNNNAVRDEGELAAVTSSNGTYAFETLEPGTYRVREVLPPGWTIVRPGDGFYVVTLAAGQTANERVFANRRTPGEPGPESASIRGVVFNDRNGDGAWQDGEPALAGWVVYLDQNANGVRDDGERAAETNRDGRYAFEELSAGSYQVREVLPAGWTITRPADGFYAVSLADGQRADERLFGNRRIGEDTPVGEPQAVLGTVGGRAFEDLDLDGVEDAGEPGVRGVRVYVDANGNGRRDRGEPRDVSDAAGAFALADVPPGQLVVKHARVRGYRPTAAAVTGDAALAEQGAAIDLAAGGHASAAFALTRKSVLRGTIFQDVNGNRAVDAADSARAGMTVFLDFNRNGALDAGEASTLTDAAGGYAFVVDRGSYRLAEVMPDGVVVSKVKVGQGRVVTRDVGHR